MSNTNTNVQLQNLNWHDPSDSDFAICTMNGTAIWTYPIKHYINNNHNNHNNHKHLKNFFNNNNNNN